MVDNLKELTAEVVSSYVSNHKVDPLDLPKLIEDVSRALQSLEILEGTKKAEPAVPIENSVTKDYIVCLEDGKKFKMLKRHLQAKYGMTPDDYRKKWGLQDDYPMVAPSYSKSRSKIAKSVGLGKKAA